MQTIVWSNVYQMPAYMINMEVQNLFFIRLQIIHDVVLMKFQFVAAGELAQIDVFKC